jgi:hypothetical protein
MADLPVLHRDLLGALDDLEALTRRPACDEAAVTALRYRLTRLSGPRRKAVQVLCESVDAEDAAVQALAAIAPVNRAASSAHIANWTLRRIVADWAGYCAASAVIRSAMRRQIEAEAAALDPYLDDGVLKDTARRGG